MGDKYGNGRLIESIMQQSQAPQLAVASPINDIQLVALMASRRPEMEPKDSVEWAGNILLEAVKQGKTMHLKIKDILTNGA